MASGANYTIHHQKHGHVMTCYRPIVFSLKTSDTNVAFFKGKLFIRDINDNWANTGVVFNAYRDQAHTGQYMCNVMEYCRQYFYTNDKFYNNAWCAATVGGTVYNDMFMQHFYVEFFPVVYGSGASLIEETSNKKNTDQFAVIPTNTRTMEGYSSIDDYIRVDKFVVCSSNGTAVSTPGSAWNETLTNMPDGNYLDVSNPLMWNIIVTPRASRPDKKVQSEWSWSGNNAGSYNLLGSAMSGWKREIEQWYMNPVIHSFFAQANGSSTGFDILDASGNLIQEGIDFTVKLTYKELNGSNWRSGPSHTVKLTDRRNHRCGSSEDQWTEFVFKNMFGGIDWFISRGVHEKAVGVGGSTYSKFTNFDRDAQDFGVWKGQHSTTSLWSQRTDEFSVTTQPLNKEQAIWLEELVTSPEVWVIHEGIDMYNNTPGAMSGTSLQPKRLVPVIISPGSYEVYSTKEKVYYMKFSYTLSEPITTQKN